MGFPLLVVIIIVTVTGGQEILIDFDKYQSIVYYHIQSSKYKITLQQSCSLTFNIVSYNFIWPET